MAETIETPTTGKPGEFLTLQEMTGDQLSQWERDGKMIPREPAPSDTSAKPAAPPAKTEPAAPADSAPAEPVEQAASTDATPEADSEPAEPEPKAKGKGIQKRNADLRAEIEENARLLRQRRELREELRRLDAERTEKPAAKPADSAPASAETPKQSWKRLSSHPDAPKPADFSGETALEDWTAAMSMFVSEQLIQERVGSMLDERFQQREALSERQAQIQSAAQVAEQRAEADEARNPQWRDRIDPAFASIPPTRLLEDGQKPNVMNDIRDLVLFECENPISMSVFMSSDEGKAWAGQLVRLSPAQIQREVFRKDLSFAADGQDAETDGRKPSLVSKAPAPAPTLGRKPAAARDDVSAALAAGDYLAFERAENAKVAARKR